MNKKKKCQLVRIYSTQSTGEFYLVRKNKANKNKVSFKKYDKKLRKHVSFAEKGK